MAEVSGDPLRDRTVAVGEASEALLEVLNANGVTELFVMPGDAFPILEAAAKYEALGKQTPRIVTCIHEVTGLAAAHGHYMVSGRPQACLFHVDIGLQAAGGMLHNAQRGRAGVVIFSGRTPMTFDGSMRGGRVIDVHWMQDRQDLGSITRDYVKWHYDLHRTEILAHVVQRAFQVAASEPAGPVSVTLLREMLMEPMGSVQILPPERYGPPRPPVPDLAALEEVASLLAAAERPVAIAGHVGRSAVGFHGLAKLAEVAALPVFSHADRANISSDCPMYLGTGPAGPWLSEADLVLVLDADVPYTPLFGRPPDDATIVQIDIDPLKPAISLWGFPVDIALGGSTAAALPLLAELVSECRSNAQARAAAERRERVAAEHTARRKALIDNAEANAGASPIRADFLSLCVADLVDDGTIVVDDSTTSRWIAARYMPTRVPGSYFQASGASMGWGAAAALGAKLAAPDRTVINLNAEGNFLHGAPEATLWTAAQHRSPTLTVVYDNAQYAAIKLGLLHEYPEGYAARSGRFPALELPSAPDVCKVAESSGADAARVEDPAELRQALRRALDVVRGGQAAVLDVAVAGP